MKNQFAKTTLSLGVLAGLTGVTPVTAQQSSVADENVEVIEVTSFRRVFYSDGIVTKTSRFPFSSGPTTPAVSMASIIRAARLYPTLRCL